MNQHLEAAAPQTVAITVAGKAIQAREGETIIHALWQAEPVLSLPKDSE